MGPGSEDRASVIQIRFDRRLLWTVCGAVMTAVLSAQNPLAFENASVRVVKAANVPSQKSRPHVHLVNRVMVHLDRGELLIDNMETGPRRIPFRAGEVRWDPKVGLHTSENTGGTAIRIVEIELKNTPQAGVARTGAEKKPFRISRGTSQKELENEQVRIWRVDLQGGGKLSANLLHPGVLVDLSDGTTSWKESGRWVLDHSGVPDPRRQWILVEIK
jgi:hypothetical protein